MQVVEPIVAPAEARPSISAPDSDVGLVRSPSEGLVLPPDAERNGSVGHPLDGEHVAVVLPPTNTLRETLTVGVITFPNSRISGVMPFGDYNVGLVGQVRPRGFFEHRSGQRPGEAEPDRPGYGVGLRLGGSGDFNLGRGPLTPSETGILNAHVFVGAELAIMVSPPPAFPNLVNWVDWQRGGLYRIPVLGPSYDYIRTMSSQNWSQVIDVRQYSLDIELTGMVEGVTGTPTFHFGDSGVFMPTRILGNLHSGIAWKFPRQQQPDDAATVDRPRLSASQRLRSLGSLLIPDARIDGAVFGFILFTHAVSVLPWLALVPVPFVIFPRPAFWTRSRPLGRAADLEGGQVIELDAEPEQPGQRSQED